MSEAPTRPPQQIIEQLRDELTRAREERDRVDADRARIERERDRLQRENTRLRQQLDAARRAGFRQAAPFSQGAPCQRPRRPARKAGRAYGRRGHRPVPSVIDEPYDVPVPATCPDCGAAVDETRVMAQYRG